MVVGDTMHRLHRDELRVNDEVNFDIKGRTATGRVTKVNNKTVHVEQTDDVQVMTSAAFGRMPRRQGGTGVNWTVRFDSAGFCGLRHSEGQRLQMAGTPRAMQGSRRQRNAAYDRLTVAVTELIAMGVKIDEICEHIACVEFVQQGGTPK